MWFWRREGRTEREPRAVAERVRAKYQSFRQLLALNNECLELMAGLQEDLRYVPPRSEVLGDRIAGMFEKVGGVVASLEQLTGLDFSPLNSSLRAQRNSVERFAAALQEYRPARLSAWLSEINATHEVEVGAKAAALGEIRNRLGLPTPDGFVLTTEAYRQFCGLPFWTAIRDATKDLDLSDLEALRRASAALAAAVMELPLPRAVEVAIQGRARTLLKSGGSLVVRSSAIGEGGARTFAGQYVSLLHVPLEQATDSYRRVIAGRFGERALSYRLSAGLRDVDSPMAALFQMLVPARASGILYTHDPADPKGKTLWITAAPGLGLDIANGGAPADLYFVERAAFHRVVERKTVVKTEQLAPEPGGGVARIPLSPARSSESSITDEQVRQLADWGLAIESHFRCPQDIEWVLDEEGRLWIVQARPLTKMEPQRAKSRVKPKSEPLIAGGRTVCPGRSSGPVHFVDDLRRVGQVPDGAVVFIRKASPEIIEIFPRIAGLVAEWGNIAGHSAALLREFRIPSVFEMTGAFERLREGDPVSLDAVQTRVYAGILWPPHRMEWRLADRGHERGADPISRSLLNLNLLDPAGSNFHPSGCKSAHDVLRYCHEKGIEAMFEVNDFEIEHGAQCARELKTRLPLNILVLDLGGGLPAEEAARRHVTPEQILSRPFQALWKGLSHPGVSWTRETPAHLSDIASVLSTSLTPQRASMRGLGEKSYLLVASDYMNLNSRLAYHYSLVDASVSGNPANNYISFRFEGGGATHERRSLRACFIEKCLRENGFLVDRRTDLVNAWFRKAPEDLTGEKLDLLGRLMACASQLDMFMTSREVMLWYARQFLEGNYTFRPPAQKRPPVS
jgi:pyruvate,water dikinase